MPLLLGLGALSVSAAQANTAGRVAGNGPLRGAATESAKKLGDLLIWNDGGRIYVSEPGKEAEEPV